MSKDFSKDQLESDVLVTMYARVYGFLQQHLLKTIVGVLAAILIIGSAVAYYVISERNEQSAQELLVYAERNFERGNYDLALYGNDGRGHAGFLDIITEYPRTSAANIARYYAAVSEMREGNYPEALYHIEGHNPPSGILGVGPISLHASILGALERYEEAERKFVEAAEWDVNSSTTPNNLLSAARAAYEAGNYSRARSHIQHILDEYPQSREVRDAQFMMGMLTARD